jgi:hypothetical protein
VGQADARWTRRIDGSEGEFNRLTVLAAMRDAQSRSDAKSWLIHITGTK